MIQIEEMTVDQSLQSTQCYGTPTFRFASFFDDTSDSRGKIITWHWHREFQFSMAVSGNTDYNIDDEHILLDSGDVLFINANTIHRYIVKSGVLKSVMFPEEFIAPADSAICQKYVEPVSSSDIKYFIFKASDYGSRRICGSLAGLFRREQDKSFMREQYIYSSALNLWSQFFSAVYDKLTADVSKVKPNRLMHDRMQKMLQYIYREYSKPIGLSDIARAANISKSEALRCFYKSIHNSPQRYLTEYRLERAKVLLSQSPEKVADIAWKTGFNTAQNFCRVFKKANGISPGDFRKHVRFTEAESL
ncbi:AraC family transcriptional regulator [Synergistes jonesii]|uniref:HTH araC/xylS-type domain-containing protein n=1 Tax=Synergistes jonesii TaxID=2754 RepID=A0A073INW9_9BACT|nr:AraC family transcriptional regulator [Synergistes jonesii]KEJ92023.1 hypothetical protein EH55_06475 [Synergistes jonesii]